MSPTCRLHILALLREHGARSVLQHLTCELYEQAHSSRLNGRTIDHIAWNNAAQAVERLMEGPAISKAQELKVHSR